ASVWDRLCLPGRRTRRRARQQDTETARPADAAIAVSRNGCVPVGQTYAPPGSAPFYAALGANCKPFLASVSKGGVVWRRSPPPFLQLLEQHLRPQLIALVAKVQPVLDEQLRPRLAVLAQHRRSHVHVNQALSLLALRLDQRVRLADRLDMLPPADARLD